jgi:hypothetical protein
MVGHSQQDYRFNILFSYQLVLIVPEQMHQLLPYFFTLKMYSADVFNLTIGAGALYFCEAVITDSPKCLDFV